MHFFSFWDYIISMKILYGSIGVIAFCLSVSACNHFYEDELVSFTLPKNDVWVARTSSGRTFKVTGDSFSILVDKNISLAIIAWDSEGNKCGAIYPYNYDLAKDYCFASDVLYSLSLGATCSSGEKNYCLSTFNWRRFENECIALGDDISKVNKENIMNRIAKGIFKKSDLKPEKKKSEVTKSGEEHAE